MRNNLLKIMTLTALIITLSFITFAHEKEQVMLDKACEAARQVALAPRKKEIYNECLNKFKKSESICVSEAQAYNGNRINGAPMFYELPPCEKAFAHKNKHK